MADTILYSFRRCPYCIRANMALWYSAVEFTLRDVELRALPAEVLAVSPEQTVPSLVVSNTQVMNNSWEIVVWALLQNDPENWLGDEKGYLREAGALVAINDGGFKQSLDRYKYATRFPERSEVVDREACEVFITSLEEKLGGQGYLLANRLTVADVALFPFIRQFSMVDKLWFDQSPYTGVRGWLGRMQASPWFIKAFTKRDIWKSPVAEGAEN